MQPIELAKLFYKNGPFIVHLGGSIDVGLLDENHHKINLIGSQSFYYMKILSPFCGSLLTQPH